MSLSTLSSNNCILKINSTQKARIVSQRTFPDHNTVPPDTTTAKRCFLMQVQDGGVTHGAATWWISQRGYEMSYRSVTGWGDWQLSARDYNTCLRGLPTMKHCVTTITPSTEIVSGVAGWGGGVEQCSCPHPTCLNIFWETMK